MTIINNVDVKWRLDPRLILVPVVASPVSIEDFQDTLLDLEDDDEGMLWPHLRNTSGGEGLGSGVTVGWTLELQNAKTMFNQNVNVLETGTVTTPDTNGTLLVDSTADFVSAGIEAGDIIINYTDKSITTVLSVDDLNTINCMTLEGGTDNQFDSADEYSIYDNEVREVRGGNLVAVDSGSSEMPAFAPSFGNYAIRTSSSSTTVQELNAIQYSSFNGGITIDIVNGDSGTEFPYGTIEQPVDNLADALTIANERGFNKFFIIGDATLDSGTDLDNFIIYGESNIKSTLTISDSASVTGTEFRNATINGVLDGGNTIKDCVILDLNYVEGSLVNCMLDGTITLAGTIKTEILNCWSRAHDVDSVPEIDYGGSGRDLIIRNFSGPIIIKNKTGVDDNACIDFLSGCLTLEDTVTAGQIDVRGMVIMKDNSNGATIVTDGMVNKSLISDAVWDETLADHTDAGSFGEKIGKKLLSVSKFLGLK